MSVLTRDFSALTCEEKAERRRLQRLAASRRWRERHPERSRAQCNANRKKPAARAKAREWRVARRERIAALKDAPCTDCDGRFPPIAMDFDHVRGVKTKSVSRMFDAPAAILAAEIAKCDLVCANCHRIRTGRRGGAY